jgi:hypothetical protein
MLRRVAGAGPGGLCFQLLASGTIGNSSIDVSSVRVVNCNGGGLSANIAGNVNQATLLQLIDVIAINNTILSGEFRGWHIVGGFSELCHEHEVVREGGTRCMNPQHGTVLVHHCTS